LVEGRDGALYGVTLYGGASNYGTVFKLNRNGTGFAVLHDFSGPEGRYPYFALIAARDGVLYGTAPGGGASESGTVFRLNEDGSGYEVLHNFQATADYSESPACGLANGNARTLYGTTMYGGANGAGAIFQLAKDGTDYVELHSFQFAKFYPSVPEPKGLVLGEGHALYGTTSSGGYYLGTVFRLQLSPPTQTSNEN
jgi:uncharacterized repeat protein (TIGR03803 family)